MKTLIFDTETTGIRPKGNVKLEDEPYVIQLAAILYDDERPVFTMANFVYSGPDVRVPTEKFFIDNGLTNEVVEAYGLPPHFVFGQFMKMVYKADEIVAHNMKFDSPMVAAMLQRSTLSDASEPWSKVGKYCTMLSLVDHLKIPGKWGNYKWPTLDEAYRALVDDSGFSGAHDALIDVRACAEVLFAMRKLNVPLLGI